MGAGDPRPGGTPNVVEGAPGERGLASSLRPAAQATATDVAQQDPEFEELRRYFRKPAQLWRALLSVPFLGLGALAADPNGGGLDQAWVLGALLVWLSATLVAASLVLPGLYQLRSMILEPGTFGPAPSAARRSASGLPGRGHWLPGGRPSATSYFLSRGPDGVASLSCPDEPVQMCSARCAWPDVPVQV